MVKTGKEYESFVARIQQALLNAEKITQQKNIKIETNKKIKDNCGIEREFDIYWEYELGGLTYKTIIECKDYNSKINVEKIDALIGKIRDIPNLKAVFATKLGYQRGAKIKAEVNKIDLLIVREQNDSDWTAPDGTPLIKKIFLNMHMKPPANIINFEIFIDEKWAEENSITDISSEFCALNNEVFIDDVEKNEKYSILELNDNLASNDRNNKPGEYEKTEKLKNAFLYHKNVKLKLAGYKVKYSIPKTITMPSEIDFTKELFGVVEYLQKGEKKSIFRNGMIK